MPKISADRLFEREVCAFVSTVLFRLDGNPRTILDLNPGLQTIELAKRLPQSLILGLTSTCNRANKAGDCRSRLNDESVHNVQYIEGGPKDLPFDDGTFDMVVLLSKLGAFCLEGRIFEEIYRALSCNGQAFINILVMDSQAEHVCPDSSEVDTIVSILRGLPFSTRIGIEKKELNLEIAFKRINWK